MELDELTIVNLPWPAADDSVLALADLPALRVSTCLRQLLLTEQSVLEGYAPVGTPLPGERLQGRAAYARLLEIGCGLHSSIAGETEIFHQIKSSWAEFEARGSTLARALRPWMQRLFQDIKDIRSRHLRDAGGSSYGSLARKLLGEPCGNGPTLLVGAGALAHSVARYIARGCLEVWNRSPQRLQEFVQSLPQSAQARALACEPAAELAAWRVASVIVLCVPADTIADPARVRIWRERKLAGHAPAVLHLGIEQPCGPWQHLTALHTLGDLFTLDATQRQRRAQQLATAKLACDEHSRRRVLGVTATPHGWEDLIACTLLPSQP